MVLYKNFNGKLLFPDTGGAGGGLGDPNAGGAGSVESDPFAGVNLEDYDSETRRILTQAQEKIARVQLQAELEQRANQHNERLAREFQGKHDSLAAQLQKLTSPNPQDPAASLTDKFTAILQNKGVSAEQAKVQAPLMLEMMNEFGATLKHDIGRDLAPFAGSVMQNDATNAWNQALSTDKVGALAIPEVAENVWSHAQTMLQDGQAVNAATIKNLSSMFYIEHLEKTNSQPMIPSPNPSRVVQNFGPSRYPGAGVAAMRPAASDPSGPRHQLNSDTNAALQSVMSKWEVKPKSFQGKKN